MLAWNISIPTATGNHEENPRYLRKAEKDIKRVQRKIYKRKRVVSLAEKKRVVFMLGNI